MKELSEGSIRILAVDLMTECDSLSDAALIREVKFLAERDRRGNARLIAHLAVMERRSLPRKEKVGDLYRYCHRVLGFDEGDSFRRSRAAALALTNPEILKMIDDGSLTLSVIAVISKPIEKDPTQASYWITEARGKSRRQVEALVAARHPEMARPDMVRRLPVNGAIFAAVYGAGAAPERPSLASAGAAPASETSPEASAMNPAPPSGEQPRPPSEGTPAAEWPSLPPQPQRLGVGFQIFVPIAVDRVRVSFDATAGVAALIARARQILKHKYPEGRLEDVIHDALQVFLDRKDPQRRLELKKAARPELPRPEGALAQDSPRLETRFLRTWQTGRYIPAKIKSAVWQRDEGRCSWREADGTICGSKEFLEYDHIRPFSKGGRSDQLRNVRLLCREHNLEAARAAGLRVPTDPPGLSASTDPASGASA